MKISPANPWNVCDNVKKKGERGTECDYMPVEENLVKITLTSSIPFPFISIVIMRDYTVHRLEALGNLPHELHPRRLQVAAIAT